MGPEDHNAVRYDPAARRDHVESYFLKANDARGERALWLKATIFATARAPERAVAEGWAIVFERRADVRRQEAVKQTVPFASATFGQAGLEARWHVPGGSTKEPEAGALSMCASSGASRGETRGSLATEGRRIAWDLAFTGEPRAITPLPAPFYDPRLPTSKLVTPYPDLRVEGEVTAFGERWVLDGWHGMQGHNWGRRHAELYAWCHVNAWDQDPEFVLEGLSARVRIGPLLTPLSTLVCVRHRGVVYDFNRPSHLIRSKGDVSLRSWSFSARSRQASIEGVVEGVAEDMVGLYYENPSGKMTYCLNSKLARARVRFEASGRPPLSLTTSAAALEIGTTNADHGVRMHV